MEYFECDVPSGDGLCSDNWCPCSKTVIPRGTGYLYIDQSLVDFRSQYRTMKSVGEAMGRGVVGPQIDMPIGLFRWGPILVCRRGAKLRNIDLKIAAADAKYWWKTGEVPLRATPLMYESVEKEVNLLKEKLKSVQELKDKGDVEQLIKVLRSKESAGVRQAAADALGEIGDLKALDPLIAVLKEKRPYIHFDWVYVAAARALGEIGDSRASETLESIANNKREFSSVRKAAVKSLKKIQERTD